MEYYRLAVYAMKETIGNPGLFTGRKEVLDFYFKWASEIAEEKSRSSALLARRKFGKSAILQRLYNVLYEQNGPVIPFYFEVREGRKWVKDFSQLFYRSFASQYLSFKLRKPEYIQKPLSLEGIVRLCKEYGFKTVCEFTQDFDQECATSGVDAIWEQAQASPHRLAAVSGEYVAQIIDEFQFLNSEIYWDEGKQNPADDLAGSYLGLAESKVAPILASGSYVGWLMHLLDFQLPARFRQKELRGFEETEGVEAVHNYSRHFNVPVTEETALLINRLCEGHPFYISVLVRSTYPGKDLTEVKGVLDTLKFEIESKEGEIQGTSGEYIGRAFSRINQRYAKKIALFLAKNKERVYTRPEIKKILKLEMEEEELEKKLDAMARADIILQGPRPYQYQGINDGVFARVLRFFYECDLEGISEQEYEERIKAEERQEIRDILAFLQKAGGVYRYHQGKIAEYCLVSFLNYEAHKDERGFAGRMYEWGRKVEFCRYKSAGRLVFSPAEGRSYEIDIYARPVDEGQALAWEVKNYTDRKVGVGEVKEFEVKLEALRKCEGKEIEGVFYSASGFSDEAREYLRQQGIYATDYERFLGNGHSQSSCAASEILLPGAGDGFGRKSTAITGSLSGFPPAIV